MPDFDETLFEPCSRCGGPMMVLGFLGRLAHARCRYCGAEEAEMVLELSEIPDLD